MSPKQSSARRPKSKPSSAEPEAPKNHLYQHTPSIERWRELVLESLGKPGSFSALRLTAKLKELRLRQQFGLDWIGSPCPVDPSHTPPEGQFAIKVRNDDFFCVVGDHVITVEAELRHLAEGDEKRLDELLKILRPHPLEFPRSYVCEVEGRSDRSVDADMIQTLASLGASVDDVIRGVAIECESLKLARQLGGQLRDSLPWCENVRRTRTGRLVTAAWHGAHMTIAEERLERELQAAAVAERHRAQEKALAELRSDLGI